MPQMGSRTSIPLVSTLNVVSGLLFERVGGRGAAIRAYMSAITAASSADLTATLIAGSDVLVQDSQGWRDGVEGIQIPEDQIAAGAALPGDQILLNVTNANAAARIVTWRIDIENA